MSETDYRYCIVGGGIVGLACALEISEREPQAGIVLLEKEDEFGLHQTGHNSGVIHAGIYYQPGSLKARLCREGAEATKRFCAGNAIPFETCGKLLVATDEAEMERMAALEARARDNDIAYEPVSAERLRRIEPNIAGRGALLIKATGIVDYRRICLAMAERLRERGARLALRTPVTFIAEEDRRVVVGTGGGERFSADRLIACAGLQSDRIARLAGLEARHRIVPFRGEYYTLPASKRDIVRHLIYPIPDPDLPFLGIHLTRMIDGRVTVGPNAVLGFSREGYAKGSVRPADVASMAGFRGFWAMARRNWRSGASEFANSMSRARYLEQCRKYCPSLTLGDLGAPGAGIRAQAILPDGTLVHDFLFLESERMLHVCNAPSPAATSAMPIAAMIVNKLATLPTAPGSST
ncbi:L-2-hydroxyglutarate oxidase [Aureimonas populi]|uniref:L-2-hydroxyglutarate oxidase n=1 Tax=Aureimonas populi TaxID=1701758 RepID=A0ABW5CQ98_9HYPH|nr:L-2-hydroxyglutarate oxidase [Aureimonas populi]